MKAMLYMPKIEKPVALLESVQIVKMNDNHAAAPYRIFYKSSRFNAGSTMVELHRDVKMALKLEDGRTCSVLLQHTSNDSKGNAVGVFRVLDASELESSELESSESESPESESPELVDATKEQAA